MSISCKQCGAALTERDAFCTKCGAPRNETAAPAVAKSFCTKCGAPLLGETKFCTKCGAVLGVAASVPASAARSGGASGASAASSRGTASGASAAKSPGGIPKIALIGAAVVILLFIVAAVAGMISAARRAREKAQEAEAAQNFAKSLENLASSGNAAAKNRNSQGNSSSAADINKTVSGLAAAANALAQNAQNMQAQNGANPLNVLHGSNGTSTGYASSPGINGGSSPPAGVTSATSAAGSRTIWAAVDDMDKRLGDLQRDAPDLKASTAVDALDSKLQQLTTAVERAPNDSVAKENLNKGLADISAAADRLTPAFVAGTDAALTPPPIPS
ncbi:MAG: zinc ribbon domain-containing protein, partial [Candidatus Acidiferrales bacterium]